MRLPANGVYFNLQTIERIRVSFGLEDLWARIERTPPSKPFIADGCSCGFDTWAGKDL